VEVVGTLLLITALFIAWIVVRIQPLIGHSHVERLENFHSSLAADREKVVICLGDSLTHGNGSFDYVHALASRLEPSGYTVLNAGINGQLAWNILQRVDQVVASEPAYVVLLVGTNDARGIEDEKIAARYVKEMSLPELPSENFFIESYRELLDELGECLTTRVIPVTLPPMGERGGGEVDELVDGFNTFIERESSHRGLACVPLGRALRERLLSDSFDDAPAYSAPMANRLIFKAMLSKYLFGWTWDRIAERHRMKLLTDMIHLNESSGLILVDLVEAKIRESASPGI
jgi:acyl-CoA thioesterase I